MSVSFIGPQLFRNGGRSAAGGGGWHLTSEGAHRGFCTEDGVWQIIPNVSARASQLHVSALQTAALG